MLEKKLKIVLWKTTHKLTKNLSVYELSSKQIEIRKIGLRHGVATLPVESEMILTLEDMSNQKCKNIKNELPEQGIKTALRASTFSYIDINEKKMFIDGKGLNTYLRWLAWLI